MERCNRCPRLRKHCLETARVKKREFREWEYWGKPVPGFGDPKASIWIVGLAPAAHGANRTGRNFTGDSSGKWLYRALYETGFSNREESISRDDDLRLRNIYVSATARCAPPANKPTPEEIANCAPFLHEEYRILKNVRLFVALGSIGFNTTLRLLESEGVALPRPRPKFAHGAEYVLGEKYLLASYHPSRQNTNTGVLTWKMWVAIFRRAAEIVGHRA